MGWEAEEQAAPAPSQPLTSGPVGRINTAPRGTQTSRQTLAGQA